MRATSKDDAEQLDPGITENRYWYDIDWDTGIHTRRTDMCLVVGSGGAVYLTTNYPRDPYERERLNSRFGIDLRLGTDLPKMATPDGRDIPKNALRDEMFLVQDGRVYNVSHGASNGALYRVYATWYSHGSAPTVPHALHTRERNPAREKQWSAERKEMFTRADGAYALSDYGERDQAKKLVRTHLVHEYVKHNKTPDENATQYAPFFVVLGHMRQQTSWREFMLDQTGDFREYPYLTIA